MLSACNDLMARSGVFALLLSLLASSAFSSSITHQPRPYTIEVDPSFIETARLRASHFRASQDIDAPAWFDGPPVANVSQVARYWANDFNFSRFQHELNTNFSTYMTTLPPPGGRYNRGLDVHFIHQVSAREDAIPILFLHGWPSTSLEWAKVIPDLVSPPNSSLPAFHVVAPDLPGFGFSPAPSSPGLGGIELATAFASLMNQLGYDRFALYSTDLGFVIARRMLPAYPDRIINHITDFYIVFPNATDTQRFENNQTTPVETAYLTSVNDFLNEHAAYSAIHSTSPLSIAPALYDSPVGFLAWIWQLFYTVSDIPASSEDLIRRTLGLYIPGPYGNIRSYKELYPEFTTYAGTFTSVPTSVLQWGGIVNYPALKNFNFVPLEWVERTANVTYFKQHDAGGHFPAESQPQLWLEDMWEIFADSK